MLWGLQIAGANAAGAAATVESGLWGGGFVNVVVPTPGASAFTSILTAGDVGGIHRTSNGGQSWSISNAGVWAKNQTNIAAVAYDPNHTSVVYAGFGDGLGGGMVKSVNGGTSWSWVTGMFKFNALPNLKEGPFVAPEMGGEPSQVRSTGNLIAVSNTGIVYAGSWNQGLYRSATGGASWQLAGLGPNSPICTVGGLTKCYIRTIAIDPVVQTTLYVGTYNTEASNTDGVVRVRNADTLAPIVDRIANTPSQVEEIVIEPSSPNRLWCACGREGMFRANSPYGTWQAANTNIETDFPTAWSGVGLASSSNSAVYAGATRPALQQGGSVYKSIKYLPAGSNTWTDLITDHALIHSRVGGPTGTQDWWLADSNFGQLDNLIDGAAYDASMITASGSKVMVTGRSGIWFSDDTGTNWYPYVAGLGVTVNKDIKTATTDANRMYVGNDDWTFFWSGDNGVQVARRAPQLNVKVALAVAVDDRDVPAPSDVFIAVGDPTDNVQGEILWNPDPSTSGWTQLGLDDYTSVTCGASMRPLGLAVGRNASGKTTIVAAVDGCGMWVGTADPGLPVVTWTQASTLMLGDQGDIVQAPVVWPVWPGAGNDKYVFVMDKFAKRLWRSQNYGATWDATALWIVQGSNLTNDTGYLAGDPSTLGRLWATTNQSNGTWLLASTNGTINPMQFTTPVDPGPVAVRPGSDDVYIAGRVNTTGDQAELWRSLNSGGQWDMLAGSFYRASSLFPSGLSVSGSPGFAYESMAGHGATVSNQI